MYIFRLLSQSASVLVWYQADFIIISLKMNLFSLWYSWKNYWVGNLSLTPLFHNVMNTVFILGYGDHFCVYIDDVINITTVEDDWIFPNF